MARAITPEVIDGRLVIDDIDIAAETDVQSVVEIGAVPGRIAYHVVKTDGEEYDVVLVGKTTGGVDLDDVYTKVEVDAKIAKVNQVFNNIRYDTSTGEIVFEKI